MQTLKKPIDWRACAYVSASNAARIAGRTHGWVRGAVTSGQLTAVQLPTGGPPVITVSSLARLIAEAQPVPQRDVRLCARPNLRVIADDH